MTATQTKRKTRRPIGMRTDVPAYDPREDGMGRVAFFEYREDAVEAAREWVEPQGWIARPQYVGRYDLWILYAKRKSWGYRINEIMVEACRNPEAVLTRHAHVPFTYAYRDDELDNNNRYDRPDEDYRTDGSQGHA